MNPGRTSNRWKVYQGEFPMSEMELYQMTGQKTHAEAVQQRKITNATTEFLAAALFLGGLAYGGVGSERTTEEVHNIGHRTFTTQRKDPDNTAMGVGLGAMVVGAALLVGVKSGKVYPARTAAGIADDYNRELVIEIQRKW
jgi:hypothetical protein